MECGDGLFEAILIIKSTSSFTGIGYQSGSVRPIPNSILGKHTLTTGMAGAVGTVRMAAAVGTAESAGSEGAVCVVRVVGWLGSRCGGLAG